MHFDHAIALYDPAEHRPLATRFGQDVRGGDPVLSLVALWFLGYPEAALDRRKASARLMLARSVKPPHRCTRLPTRRRCSLAVAVLCDSKRTTR